MKISIDLDGVLCNFTAGVIQKANRIWPGKMALSYEPTDWNYSDVFTKDEWSRVWEDIKASPSFFEDLPPYQDNLQFLREFLQTESDHEIYYVTSRAVTTGRPVAIQTESWLCQNHVWPEDNYHAVIPVAEPGLKKFVMADLGIQYSIDDYGMTVSECRDVKNHKPFLLDRPWNRDQNYGTRVFDLKQFFNMATGKMPADYYLV